MLFTVWNGPMPTTALQAAAAITSTLKTQIQLKAFNPGTIVEWGFSTDLPASAGLFTAELLATDTVFATVTTYADADIAKTDSKADQSVASIAGLTLGTSASGYGATAEGSITTTRVFDGLSQTIGTTQNGWHYKQWPLGFQPKLIIGDSYRIRCSSTANCNARCYLIINL